MFGEPYIRDTARRREAFFHHDGWNDWDRKLSGLTDELYALHGGLELNRIRGAMVVEGGPGIDLAMLEYARRNKLLPCQLRRTRVCASLPRRSGMRPGRHASCVDRT